MKISRALELPVRLYHVVRCALLPTIQALWQTPALIFSSTMISRLFMARVWIAMGDSIDEGRKVVKSNLIIPNAYGTILDLGAGHGHTVKYLDREKVSRYIALEPNTFMHQEIRKLCNAEGFTESDGSLLVLSCGAEDISSVLTELQEPNSVDTLISILTLCSVPEPEQTLSALVRYVLKPGGTLLFYEHVLSPRDDVAWWQRFWSPVWGLAFDGCKLNRPTHLCIESMRGWSGGDWWVNEGEDEESLLLHCSGKFVKSF